MANDHGGMKVLKARNEGEDQNEKALTLNNKPSPERVMKSCLKCFKLEAPSLYSLTATAEIRM